MRKKQKRNLIIGILIGVVILGLALGNNSEIPFLSSTTSDSTFTPIFCNDYEFTCCTETSSSNSINLAQGEYYQCPSYATRCSFYSNYGTFFYGLGNCFTEDPWYASPYWDCSEEYRYSQGSTVSTMSPNSYIYPTSRGQCVGSCPSDLRGTFITFQEKLYFCGRSGCTQGVPVQGADGCKFNPTGTLYTESGNPTSSKTVPVGECRLAYQSGDRHICGYMEEQCSSNSDCGGHTYGNKECYSRTLQTYGCRTLQDPNSQKDYDLGWLLNSDLSYTASRCEVISTEQVQCCGDTDCGSGMFCDTISFTCKKDVQCTSDYDCGVSVVCDSYEKKIKTPKCSLGQCTYSEESVECCTDNNCPTGYYCGADYTCKEKIAECSFCPYECCVDLCTSEGGYLDKQCPESSPYCQEDNTCSTEPPVKEDCDCWDWLKEKSGQEIECKDTFWSDSKNSLICPFYFLKLFILLIACFILLSPSQEFIKKQFKGMENWIVWVISLIFIGLVFFIGYLFLTWYFVIPVLIVSFVVKGYVDKIPGAKRLRKAITRR